MTKRKKPKMLLTEEEQRIVRAVAIAAADRVSEKWQELIGGDELVVLSSAKIGKVEPGSDRETAVRLLLMTTFAARLGKVWTRTSELQLETIWKRTADKPEGHFDRLRRMLRRE